MAHLANDRQKELKDIATVNPGFDPLIVRGYEAVRGVLRSGGVNPTPKSRVAFGDDDSRHTSGWLGGTRGNDAPIERVAFVQVWEVSGKYEMQLHIYDPEHPSTQPLKQIAQLAQRELPETSRCERTDSVASELSADQFDRFVRQVEALIEG